MPRCLHIATALALLLGCTLAPAAAAEKPTSACQAQQPRHDRLDVRCTWAAGSAPPALRFDAHFAGSHDDTTARLDASVDGVPLTCAAGSKTTIDGQDEGEVTLTCRVVRAKPIGAASVLRFELAWYHARYTGFELVPE